jgi:hypothetical protein
MDTFVTHNQLLIILIIVLLGAGIFAYGMLKHAIELRQKTTQVIEDLSVVQTYIDVELAEQLLKQQVSIDKLIWNQGITYLDLITIRDSTTFGAGVGGLGNVTVNDWLGFP